MLISARIAMLRTSRRSIVAWFFVVSKGVLCPRNCTHVPTRCCCAADTPPWWPLVDRPRPSRRLAQEIRRVEATTAAEGRAALSRVSPPKPPKPCPSVTPSAPPLSALFSPSALPRGRLLAESKLLRIGVPLMICPAKEAKEGRWTKLWERLETTRRQTRIEETWASTTIMTGRRCVGGGMDRAKMTTQDE